MKILAIDTASFSTGVAIIEDRVVKAEVSFTSNTTHTRRLLEMVDHVLAKTSTELLDLDGFAVTVGPGSFTGLRIGISTVKGLAFAARKPVAGVSSLDALASGLMFSASPVYAMLFAKRNEVYWAQYELKHGLLTKTRDEVVAGIDAVLEIAGEAGGSCIFVGDGAVNYKSVIEERLKDLASFAPGDRNFIRAAGVGLLGADLFDAGAGCPAEKIVPVYLRRSDAELNFEKKMAKSV